MGKLSAIAPLLGLAADGPAGDLAAAVIPVRTRTQPGRDLQAAPIQRQHVAVTLHQI